MGPLFRRSPRWESVVYWSLDLETGGLDPRTDPILAVGMVPVRRGVIRLVEAYRTLVRPEDGRPIAPGSVRAHQLVWGEVREAPPLAEALREIDRRQREGVLLVHQRRVEVGFLSRAYRRHGLRWHRPRIVDTVDLLVRAARMADPHVSRDRMRLNLARARQRYGLPHYQAHDALTDAVATAELFLVLRHHLGAKTLRDLR